MADESYWTYRTSEPTPTLKEALYLGAIAEGTTERDWHQLTPGMRSEIVRGRRREIERRMFAGEHFSDIILKG